MRFEKLPGVVTWWQMPTGNLYRVKAVEMSKRAREGANAEFQAALHALAMAYRRLADHVDRRQSKTRETPAQPTLQQQQPQSKKPVGIEP
jgi:hypothetical protein